MLEITTLAERPEYLERMYEFVAHGRSIPFVFPDEHRSDLPSGGTIVQVAPRSMVIAGTLDEWRTWTGLPFDRTGDVVVPKALVPVHMDVEHNHAVYVEPNVWIRHDL